MIIPAAWHFLVVHNHLLHIDHLHHTAEQLVVTHLQCREELAQVTYLLQDEEELVDKAAVGAVVVVVEPFPTITFSSAQTSLPESLHSKYLIRQKM